MNTSLDIPAITTIQSYCRGHIARQKAEKYLREFLPYDLFLQAISLISHPETLDTLPRAPHGKSKVFLPESPPIVIKNSPKAEKRFAAMNEARSLCELQGYSLLAIPKVRRVGDFVIEERLPITAWTTKEQMGLYYEHRELFAEAIKEFMGFLCQSNLPYLTTSSGPYGCLSRSPMGRYDNICFFIENGVGKIGLIDLERFSLGVKKPNWSYAKCHEALILFPYHYGEIISVAEGFDPKIKKYLYDFLQFNQEALERFTIAYADHMDFLKHKTITCKNPDVKVSATRIRIELITEKMVACIKKADGDDTRSFFGCLGSDHKATFAAFVDIVPTLCTLTADFLSEMIVRKLENKAIAENWQLAEVRSIELEGKGVKEKYHEFRDAVESRLSMFILNDLGKFHLASMLVNFILREMENVGAIAYYNDSFHRLVLC